MARRLSPHRAEPSRVFLDQAAQCEGRSELYTDLCRRYAVDPVAAEIVGPDPGWDAPLRLLGGLHYLVLGGQARWDDPLAEHREFLSEFVATQGVQTNEVQRSWALLPLFLHAVGSAEVHVVDSTGKTYTFIAPAQVLAPPGLAETAQRAGHIPGATNIPWAKAANDDGSFKPRQLLLS